jgi:hypothetical protein
MIVMGVVDVLALKVEIRQDASINTVSLRSSTKRDISSTFFGNMRYGNCMLSFPLGISSE